MKTHISTLAALALLFFITAALCQGCKKDDSLPWPLSELPPATQTGENTFGCLINGEPFLPGIYVWDPLAHDFVANYDELDFGFEADSRLVVHAHYKQYKPNDTVSIIIGFGIYPLFHEGEYTREDMDYFNAESGYTKNGPYKDYRIDTSATAQNKVIITRLDTAKNIVSGSFKFDLRRVSDTTDILRIREGRFDTKYGPW